MRFLVVAQLFFIKTSLAQIVVYDGAVFPEAAGWHRDSVAYPAERWIEAGWLVQETEPAGDGSEQDAYRRSIAEFAGAASFFVEWRVLTDGPRRGIPAGSPCGLTATGFRGVRYHFTIAEDQARLIDSGLNVILFEVGGGAAHTYRVEVRGVSYAVAIDGQQVYGGTTSVAYPTDDSFVVFWARAPGESATTRWDYIRFGVIPDAEPADVNCDGMINLFDVDPFILALFDPTAYAATYPNCDPSLADLNRNGVIEFFDIDPFVACVLVACP